MGSRSGVRLTEGGTPVRSTCGGSCQEPIGVVDDRSRVDPGGLEPTWCYACNIGPINILQAKLEACYKCHFHLH